LIFAARSDRRTVAGGSGAGRGVHIELYSKTLRASFALRTEGFQILIGARQIFFQKNTFFSADLCVDFMPFAGNAITDMCDRESVIIFRVPMRII
jgi:hypothetical protein